MNLEASAYHIVTIRESLILFNNIFKRSTTPGGQMKVRVNLSIMYYSNPAHGRTGRDCLHS